ncbi:DNA mismatch repair protein MutS, partial [Corallococcus praedator]
GYIRKQTLTNEERYITGELKDRESTILHARHDLGQLEYDIFGSLREQVGQHADEIRILAQAIASVDVLCAFAEIAVYRGYCRPQIVATRELAIESGRHPVVEQSLPSGFFVPNSVELASQNLPDLIILTGPNASGKSCYLRQVGLIQLLAQVGSFTPAT